MSDGADKLICESSAKTKNRFNWLAELEFSPYRVEVKFIGPSRKSNLLLVRELYIYKGEEEILSACLCPTCCNMRGSFVRIENNGSVSFHLCTEQYKNESDKVQNKLPKDFSLIITSCTTSNTKIRGEMII